MQIQWQGETLGLDLEDISLRHSMAIQKLTGLTVMDFLDGIDRLDPKAMLAAYWLAHEQSGKRIDVNQADFPVIKFMRAIRDALVAEKESAPDGEDPKDGAASEPSTQESSES